MATATPATLPVPTRMAMVVQKDAKVEMPDSESPLSRMRFHMSPKWANWKKPSRMVKYRPLPTIRISIPTPQMGPFSMPIKLLRASIKLSPFLFFGAAEHHSIFLVLSKIHKGKIQETNAMWQL